MKFIKTAKVDETILKTFKLNAVKNLTNKIFEKFTWSINLYFKIMRFISVQGITMMQCM